MMPDEKERRQYKRKHEYVIMMVYLVAPLFLFHLEILLFNAGYSFTDVSAISIIILFILQVIVFGYGVYRLYRFVSGINQPSR
jgi:hypothetical protein